MDKIPGAQQYIYIRSNSFPENFLTFTKVPFEILKKLNIDHRQNQLRNHNAENQPFTFTNITENINKSPEASPTEQNLDTIINSQPMDTKPKETNETDFNSTLLEHNFCHTQ